MIESEFTSRYGIRLFSNNKIIIVINFRATRPRSNFTLASSLQMSSFAHPATAETAGQDNESTPDTEDGQSAASDDDLPPLGPLWVARTMSRSVTDAVANDEQFDIYIGEVRFITDNATIIKVITFLTYSKLFPIPLSPVYKGVNT